MLSFSESSIYNYLLHLSSTLFIFLLTASYLCSFRGRLTDEQLDSFRQVIEKHEDETRRKRTNRRSNQHDAQLARVDFDSETEPQSHDKNPPFKSGYSNSSPLLRATSASKTAEDCQVGLASTSTPTVKRIEKKLSKTTNPRALKRADMHREPAFLSYSESSASDQSHMQNSPTSASNAGNVFLDPITDMIVVKSSDSEQDKDGVEDSPSSQESSQEEEAPDDENLNLEARDSNSAPHVPVANPSVFNNLYEDEIIKPPLMVASKRSHSSHAPDGAASLLDSAESASSLSSSDETQLSLLQFKFKCSYPNCNSRFATSSNLKRHEHTTHGLKQEFTCVKCKLSFRRSDKFREHMRTHSGMCVYQIIL